MTLENSLNILLFFRIRICSHVRKLLRANFPTRVENPSPSILVFWEPLPECTSDKLLLDVVVKKYNKIKCVEK